MRKSYQCEQGIALVSVLLALAAIMALGLGTMFLTNMNLTIAENVRSAAIARAHAEAGLDTSLVALQRIYKNTNTFPSSLTAPVITTPSGALAYTLIYTVMGSDQARLVVRAAGPRGGSYQSEMLVQTASPTPVLIPALEHGLTTEGIVQINGQSNYVSAGIHGNLGFSLNNYNLSQFKTCLARNASGVCTEFQVVPLEALPVSAASGRPSYTCNPANSDICIGGVPRRLTEAAVVNPNYRDNRDDAIAKSLGLVRYKNTLGAYERDINGAYYYASPTDTGQRLRVSTALNSSAPDSAYRGRCTKTYTSLPALNSSGDVVSAGFTFGSVICVESGTLTLPAGMSLHGVTIIANDTVQFNGNQDIELTNTTLISRNGGVNINPNKVIYQDTAIFSSNDISFNGQHSAFRGTTTIASARNITVNGSSEISRDGNSTPTIGIALIAGGNITVNGNANWYAAAIAGGTFTYNGNTTLYGRVAAKGTITANGGIDIDAGLAVENPFLMEERGSSVEVLSRR